MQPAGSRAEIGLDEIDTIDLTMVGRKIMDPEEGEGWAPEFTAMVEKRYRRFLYMTLAYPNRSIVPTKDIDAFWHQHILDTRAYAQDCERVFGQFLHHFPYFGMRGEADARNLASSFEDTKALYLDLFGEEYVFEQGGLEAGKCVKCGSGPFKCHHPPRCK
jgi:hypothetical protein